MSEVTRHQPGVLVPWQGYYAARLAIGCGPNQLEGQQVGVFLPRSLTRQAVLHAC